VFAAQSSFPRDPQKTRMTKHFSSPIITVFSRRVLRGHEQQYEDWTRGINAAAAQFPGSLGATVLRSGANQCEFHTVLQFDSAEHMDAWLESPERAEWVDQLSGITIESEEINSLTGMERWFTLPSQGVAQAPPRWKTASLLLLGLYPASYLMAWLIGPFTAELPGPLEKLIIMIATIVVMVWGVMPGLTRLFFGWLYPNRHKAAH